ncbi:glycosyltransferase family 52 [Vibrio splendidus]
MKNIITYQRISSDYENVCYVNSIFALFLYLYINQGDKNTLFVSHTDFEVLLKASQLNNVIIVDTKLNNNWDSLAYKFGTLKYDISEFIAKKLFFGHDHLTYAFLFDLENGSILEDGIGNYAGPIPLSKQFKRAIKGRVIDPLGYSNTIKSVYLSKPSQVDKKLVDKLISFDIKEMLKHSRDQGLSLIIPNHRVKSFENKNILFTQPISEMGLVSEQEKISLYKTIIDNNQISIIKPHPRDYTNYENFFNCEVINKSIPAETLIGPEDINIKLFTLNSTSLYNLQEVNSNIEVNLLVSDLHQYLANWKANRS